MRTAGRFFNASGPVVAEDHHCIAPLGRLDLDQILRLIATKRYFVLHAPRQTGKTSALLAESAGEITTGGSAFNIKAESLRLGDFDEAETRALLGQHTEATGQAFTEAALAAVWDQSQGQPWLVNALAHEACFRNEVGRDRTLAIDEDAIMEAREQLVIGRQTHPHQLDKLRGERVQRVIEPVLGGEDEAAKWARTTWSMFGTWLACAEWRTPDRQPDTAR